ncbi:enoyl-CoA hydratase/isomerase family protein [Sphingobium phenoxybenzoativorans]|uniref:Enoyl-CoA hydratase/isomerase family protein n=2 Tax=Sphingobium phenoxybenzoativorans TaxID=1592790 RepID=A0A975Q3P2_9SPHN|nr:enoyl-CoA hydratase/isomerase family protein [Sphingobium phenoxybenzoativorans]
MTYPEYESLKLAWPAERVLSITLARGKMNAMDFQLHHDLAHIWSLIDKDPGVNAVIVTGEGRAFSAGGDFDMIEDIITDHDFRCKMWKDARTMIDSMLNCSKPIISAINGAAAGGGLAVALLADISVAAQSAKLVDGHTVLGVAADDHAVAIWPLLTSMAKAKYYLMTSEPISGSEAERIGLVSFCVPDEECYPRALGIAERLAKGPPAAVRWTKLSLNNWMKAAWPAFEASLAFGILGFTSPEAREGLDALKERRAPNFNPQSFV